MITITKTGSIDQIIREVRGIPARLVPYAASTALTRIAQSAAKVDLPAEMSRVFDRPTPYAMNSLFVVPATAQTLSARVMVKNTAGRGIVPEKFLQPEVEGGGRNEKGFEKALRYAGILKSGERALPSRELALDAYGNVPGPRLRSILNQLKTGGQKASVFAGAVGRKKTRGIWIRKGTGKNRTITPLMIFTTTAPRYRARLDFTGVVQRVAEKNFKDEFSTALNALLKR